MEPYVRAYLEMVGAIGPDGIGLRVQVSKCPGCGRSVLRGLDSRTAAVTVTADPAPIDATGQVLALLHGLSTYRLVPHEGSSSYGRRLSPRRSWHIAHDDGRHPVVSSHDCTKSPLVPRRAAASLRTSRGYSTDPPF